MAYFQSKLLASTALACVVATSSAHALVITADETAATLADTLFLNSTGLSNVVATTSGNSAQFGTFTNDSGTYGLPAAGIALSTGNVADYGDGENNASGNTTGFGAPANAAQEALLDPITGGDFNHNDVAQLSITFDAADDVTSVTFFGTFGSEEFPEFQGSTFIDGFGLFVNGENVAFVNGSPVNVDHPDFLGAFVDGGFDGEFPDGEFDGEFPDGEFDGEFPVAFNVDEFEGEFENTSNNLIETGDPRLALVTGTELDGVIAPDGNPVLRFDVPVVAGESNTFEIIIADTSDDVLDSTIYLSSFQPTEIDLNDGSTEFTPLLPGDQDPNTGTFLFDLGGIANLDEIFFIDPPVEFGYTYTVEDAEFTLVQAPSLATIADTDGFLLTVGGQDFTILAGQVISFADLGFMGVTEFTLSGIDESLNLDPSDPLAFPLGVALGGVVAGISPVISQTPIDFGAGTGGNPAAVPVPGALPLMLGATLSGLLVGRRRRKS